MANRKPSTKKRAQKKKTTQKNKELLIKKGYSAKDQKRLPKNEKQKLISKVQKNEREKQRIEKNRKVLQKHNISGNYIIDGKKYTPSQIAKFGEKRLNEFLQHQQKAKATEQKKAVAKAKRTDLQNRKIDRLTQGGFSREQAEKYKNKSFKDIEGLIFLGDRTVYNSGVYLSVLYSDVTGESDFYMIMDEISTMSTSEIISEIHRLINNAVGDNSSGFKGVAKIIQHYDKDKLLDESNRAYWQGYNYKMITESNRVMTSNEFTVRGYASMMYSIMSRTKAEFIRQYYYELETFAHDYLPEIHRQIFG